MGEQDSEGDGCRCGSQPQRADCRLKHGRSCRFRCCRRIQADPDHAAAAAAADPALLAEFAAAPWLLPPAAAAALPYAGVTSFDALLGLRSVNNRIALIPFNFAYGIVFQNCSEWIWWLRCVCVGGGGVRAGLTATLPWC